jgi:hypothetical protein
MDFLGPCIAPDGKDAAISGGQAHGHDLVGGQLPAQGLPGGVDALVKEGALDRDCLCCWSSRHRAVFFRAPLTPAQGNALGAIGTERGLSSTRILCWPSLRGEEDDVIGEKSAKLYTTPEDTLEVARRLDSRAFQQGAYLGSEVGKAESDPARAQVFR